MVAIAWGRKVSKAFKKEAIAISSRLGCNPSHLMSAMAFETGESFSPSIQNKGLDANKDGEITRGEAAAKVQAKLIEGLGKSLRG